MTAAIEPFSHNNQTDFAQTKQSSILCQFILYRMTTYLITNNQFLTVPNALITYTTLKVMHQFYTGFVSTFFVQCYLEFYYKPEYVPKLAPQ